MEAAPPAEIVDRATLTAVVRRALDDDTAQLDAWQVEPLRRPAGSGFTAGVYRVAGTAQIGTDARGWSLVLKRVSRQPGTDAYDDPAGTPYWRREACAYESGLLDALPTDGIVAPRCFGVVERAGGTVELWLEDVPDTSSARWPAALYQRTAR